MESEGYNVTFGECIEAENSTFINLEVSNYNDNPNTDLSVLNLVGGSDGVIGVLREELFASRFSFISNRDPRWDPHVATGVNRLHE